MGEITPGHVAIARVLGAWGPRGAVKVDPLAPQSVLTPGRKVRVSRQEREIQDVQRSGRHLRLKLTGIDEREAAKALRDVFIEVPESGLDPLPPGEYYRFQLLGLTVRSIDGQELGRVVDVLAAPENDVYVTRGEEGDVLIPAVDDVVRDIDLSSGVIVVEIVPGLLPP